MKIFIKEDYNSEIWTFDDEEISDYALLEELAEMIECRDEGDIGKWTTKRGNSNSDAYMDIYYDNKLVAFAVENNYALYQLDFSSEDINNYLVELNKLLDFYSNIVDCSNPIQKYAISIFNRIGFRHFYLADSKALLGELIEEYERIEADYSDTSTINNSEKDINNLELWCEQNNIISLGDSNYTLLPHNLLESNQVDFDYIDNTISNISHEIYKIDIIDNLKVWVI